MTGGNGMSLKESYAWGCKQRTGRCTALSTGWLMPLPGQPSPLFCGGGEEGEPIRGAIMRDYKNIKADESLPSPVSDGMAHCAMRPDGPGCASQPCLGAEDRKYERCGGGLTFIKVSVSRIVWKPTALLYYTLHRSVPCSFFLVF